jgi:RNA polymerase sigma factor (sigma-70 family)
MSSNGSVTAWIGQLQAGEEDALKKLLGRYRKCLVARARRRLKGVRGLDDEEGVVQEAVWSFYRRLKAGQEFRLTSRHDLLALLTHIIACKAVNLIDHELCDKRDIRKLRGESALAILADSGEPTPLEQAVLDDCYRHCVSALPDKLRDVAELHLAGYTHKEIAARLGCVERTVERKMALILRKWQEIAEQGDNEGPGAPPGNA